ncbi:MAG TPA: hypothetical protein VFY10_16000, partial [Dehalococcoidia bacterium]|nr:hypothetical protein [Dehalococcoidia bacterium]
MRFHTALVLLPLFAAPTIAMAQDPGAGEQPPACHRTSRLTGCDTLPGPAPVVIRKQVNIPLTVKLEPPKSNACHAHMSFDYGQFNTLVRVNSTITNDDCAASRGKYVVEVTLDAHGKLENLRFDETWERKDDQPVTTTKEYPIGKNVDLVLVRATRL